MVVCGFIIGFVGAFLPACAHEGEVNGKCFVVRSYVLQQAVVVIVFICKVVEVYYFVIQYYGIVDWRWRGLRLCIAQLADVYYLHLSDCRQRLYLIVIGYPYLIRWVGRYNANSR